MGYEPRHAMRRAAQTARRLSWPARTGVAAVAVAGLAGGGMALAGGAGAATASFTVPSGGGVVTEIVLDNGGYTKCLNDFARNSGNGAPVDLYTCSSTDPASEWVTYPDNTIRPYLYPSLALSDVGGKAVLEPVAASGATTSQQWYYRDDGALVNGSGAGTSFAEPVLNDPGYNTANGTQAIAYTDDYSQGALTSNAHWWVTKARFATTALSDRPDSGGKGNWADDDMTRASEVLYMGPAATGGGYAYQGSVYDTGSFHALAGAYTPNQALDPNVTLGDSLGGSLVGASGYTFDSSSFVSQSPPSSASGSSPATSTWYQQFFASGATSGPGEANSGPFGWGWYYTSNVDNCSNIEHWADADFDNGGQSTTAPWNTDITAPAVGTCTS